MYGTILKGIKGTPTKLEKKVETRKESQTNNPNNKLFYKKMFIFLECCKGVLKHVHNDKVHFHCVLKNRVNLAGAN